MATSIVLFDIPCQFPGKAWSLNTWKIRYILQFKRIAFETRWVEYPDIERICRAHGIVPTRFKADGSLHYTCPAIVDRSTGAALAESALIADYLDETYPNTPKAFPAASTGLQFAFAEVHDFKFGPGWPLIAPAVAKILNPHSAEYFIRTRSERFGKPLDELITTEEERLRTLAKFQTEFWAIIEGWYSKTQGPFLMGGIVSYADFIIASDVRFLAAVWGEESKNWEEFRSWHDGKWVKLRDEVDRLCHQSSE
ncbi:hypothetical protein P691DRAFT_812082 [Macrolepiota fuliginosa MF-IS2]|uniref:GST N-terminal domain-containing protein n=1 Tax=Macrolepiota fuliginosa MF-IS2 TaxID=1400762 RepID=A0A9P6BVF6_9AGAR|nr:hypothetical protein P691DRAFT_812082 [Macrolepiota fuliginosa MF-IS2]